ncbi:MAG: hypothetical protein ACPMAQ_05160, partial [Phycisphaerae bacterium]
MFAVAAGACVPADLTTPLSGSLAGPLSLAITTDSPRVFPLGGRPAGRSTTTLRAAVSGGVEPYEYQWSVTNPRGETENDRLDALDVANPVFTGGSLVGDYQVTCLVTDSAGSRITSAVVVRVSQPLSCDLAADRSWVPTGGGPNGRVTLTAKPLGGVPPYTCEWAVTAPNGEPDNARLAAVSPDTAVFASANVFGTYQITCTVTDSTGALAEASARIAVSNVLSVDVTADRLHLAPGGGTGGVAYLSAEVLGGAAPYGYSWAVTGPDGTIDVFRLDNARVPQPLFTSGSTIGTYRVTCTVTDASGQQVADSVLLTVSQNLDMNVTTNRQRIVAGGGANGTAALSATVLGGISPYTYLWSVRDEAGNSLGALLSDTKIAAPQFVSNGNPGTYRIACTVTDAAGQVATDSLEIVVGQQLVGNLNSSSQWVGSGGLSASAMWVAAGGGWAGQATITAEVIGGTPPYTYTWSVRDPAGQPADDRLSGVTAATRTFTSTNVTGTYQISCYIADAMGVGFRDSVAITVYDALLVDVTIDRQQMPAGGGANGTAHLSVSVAGGTPPYTYAWTVTGPDNAVDNARLDDPAIATPTFTSAMLNGIYRATCVVTDAVGQQVSDSILFLVGQPLSIDVTTDRQDVVAGGGHAALNAVVMGGLPPYQYAWTVTNPNGLTENARLDDLAVATPTFTSDLTIGTYTLTCLVVDAAGFSAIESIMIVVGGGLDQGLSVEVTTARQSLPAAGEQAILAAAATGGVAPITYSWTVVGPNGEDATTALNDATIPGPTFTAPAAVGTYRVSCTVTDSVLKTFTASTHIYVGMGLSLDLTASRIS